MALASPFCIGQDRKLMLTSVHSGFGYCDNFNVDALYKVAPDLIFPYYDIVAVHSQNSVIRFFEQGQGNKIIKRIICSLGRIQLGSLPGVPIAPQRSIARLVILKNPPKQETLPLIIFDPLFLDKSHATEAGTTGTDWEVAAAWPNNKAGKIFNWRGADVVFSVLFTLEGVHNLELNFPLQENADYAVIFTPAYHDRVFYDTSTGVLGNLFNYAGSVPTGGTDYRASPVIRTLNVIGDSC